jgi:hypothetical protein
MGAAVGAACRHPVYWASHERSRDTADRAAHSGFIDAGDTGSLVAASDIVVSVCPPHAALDVAGEVASHGFAGVYVDANAVSPNVAAQIDEMFDRFVDGSIVGPPPLEAGTTRLYLAGDEAADVAACWEGSALEPKLLDAGPGAASALKMAYAGWSKGSAALLLAMRAYAEAAGVGGDLVTEWSQSMPELVDRVDRVARGVGPKAWRFAGEMEQIAAALAALELPSGFHEGAAVIYSRLTDLKGVAAPTEVEVIGRLTGPGQA